MNGAAEPLVRSRSIDGLAVFALGYLAIPNVIFIFGWFRLLVALVLCGLLLYLFSRIVAFNVLPWRLPLARSGALLVIVAGFAWAAFSGGAHFMHADHDWAIRDAVLGDLVRYDWPVAYAGSNGVPVLLRSAIGFFLPAALWGKLFGTAGLHLAVYLWTATGVAVFLLLLPLPKTAGRPLLLALLLVVFFSGMDFPGLVFATQSLPIFPLRLEWWVPLSYPSLAGQLNWAPNHCLPAWIGAALIFRHRDADRVVAFLALLLPLLLIWSPFAPLALLPYAALVAAGSFRRHGSAGVCLGSLVVAGLFAVPLCLFLLLDAHGMQAVSLTTATAGGAPALRGITFPDYFIFIVCEFALLALVLAPAVRQSRDFFLLSVAILLLLPALRFGPSNDLLIRLSAPALVMLLIFCLRLLVLARESLSRARAIAAWCIVFIGALTAVNELWRAATFSRQSPDYQTALATKQGGRVAAHYGGRLDSPLLEALLRPVAPGEAQRFGAPRN